MISRTILAIDLSTPRGDLAVRRGAQILFEAAFTAQRSHNAELFAPLARALEVAGDALDLVVVGTGPGSYTGVRIAIAAGQGVGLARGVPVIGWPSIAAPQTAAAEFRVIGDARRGLFYTAGVRGGVVESSIELHDADTARQQAMAPESGPWLTFDAAAPLALPHVLLAQPSASRLAGHVAALSDDEIARRSAMLLEPVYLQDPFITTSKRRGKMPGLGQGG